MSETNQVNTSGYLQQTQSGGNNTLGGGVCPTCGKCPTCGGYRNQPYYSSPYWYQPTITSTWSPNWGSGQALSNYQSSLQSNGYTSEWNVPVPEHNP